MRSRWTAPVCATVHDAVSQIVSAPVQPPQASNLPLGLQATVSVSVSSSLTISAAEAGSQIFVTPVWPAVATAWPSGCHEALLTQPLCSPIGRAAKPAGRYDDTLAVASSLPEAIVEPPGLHATLDTQPLWPGSV